jgi:Flp pilus assembly protein protease CpaA
MFTISFYIFSLFLSYTDFKRFIVPNNIVIAMTIMMLSFGYLESKIYISSILLPLFVLLFFIVIILLKRDLILGGGDIKYMMLIALYLDVQSFALFLVFTGILQTLSLLYVQKIRKHKIAPMVPFMFLSVFIVDVLVAFKVYPF